MEKTKLRLDALAVETFATTPEMAAEPVEALKLTAATSCPRPGPVCTC